jgi:DNA invertase Pin-like site-specific DNA recombinase
MSNLKIAYIRVSKADGEQTLDLQRDAILAEGVDQKNIYQDHASGKKEDRPGLENCLKALREGDTLIVWKLDRLGRDLKHLVNLVQDLSDRKIGFKVLTGEGANIDTSTPTGKFIFGVFASLAEFERDLIRERTMAGLKSARARGRKGGRRFQLTKSQIRFISTTMKDQDTKVSELCKEIGISSSTLYRYVSPNGDLRDYAKKVLES